MSITGIIGAASGAQTANVYLQLGDVQFGDMEVPDKLPFGGAQRLGIKKLLGGTRVIDVMGPDDEALSWSGRFRGSLALNRATYLDAARRAGSPLPLTWSVFNYTVVIQSFVADYERDWEISYRISCAVLRDNRNPDQPLQLSTVDQMVSTDLFAALGYAEQVPLDGFVSQIQSVVGGVEAVQTAIGAAGSLSGNISGLATVASALAIAQTATFVATTAVDQQLSSVANLGGIVVGATASANAASLLATGTLLMQSANLHQTGAYLNRMSINVAGALNQ
jgi:hypothetical protein